MEQAQGPQMTRPVDPVFHRKVFYIPGYDPIHPRRYRELYRKEGADHRLHLAPFAAQSRRPLRLARRDRNAPLHQSRGRGAGLVRPRPRLDENRHPRHLSATDPHRLGLYRIRRALCPDAIAQGADDCGPLPDRPVDPATGLGPAGGLRPLPFGRAGPSRLGPCGRSGAHPFDLADLPALRQPAFRLLPDARLRLFRAKPRRQPSGTRSEDGRIRPPHPGRLVRLRRGSDRRPLLWRSLGGVDPVRSDPRGAARQPPRPVPADPRPCRAHGILPAQGAASARRSGLPECPPRTDLGRCHGPRRRLRLCALRSGVRHGRRPAGQTLAPGDLCRLHPDPVARTLESAALAVLSPAFPVPLCL